MTSGYYAMGEVTYLMPIPPTPPYKARILPQGLLLVYPFLSRPAGTDWPSFPPALSTTGCASGEPRPV